MKYLLLFVALCSVPALASPCRVEGYITSSQGEAASYANVVFLHPSDSTYAQGTTAADDGYYAASLVAGSYVMKVSGVGYGITYRNLTVTADTMQVDVVVEPQAVALHEVVTTAFMPTVKRRATGFSVQVDNVSYLQDKSVDKILNLSPGIFISHDGQISINGIGGTTVIVDDKTLRLTDEQLMAYLTSMQGSDLKDIEIITNPTAAYDAEGGGGVIRINTRRKRDSGVTGYVSGKMTYDKHPGYNTAAGIAYTAGKVTLYGNYSYGYATPSTLRRQTDTATGGSINDITQDELLTQSTHNWRAGIDYNINNSHYVGVEYNGRHACHNTAGNTSTLQYLGDYTGRIATDITGSNTPHNNLFNLNYRWLIDTVGQQLRVIADYSDVNNSTNATTGFCNRYYDAHDVLTDENNRLQQVDEAIDILTLQADYETRLGTRAWKLNAGAKYVNVHTDYRYRFTNYNPATGAWEVDARYNDHFNYREERYALYATGAYTGTLLEANAGLRAEYTLTDGLSYATDQRNKACDFRLFPSLFLYYKPSTHHGLMLYYGMRIDRPGYELVNPYVYYVSDVAVSTGNPRIRPQISNSIEFTYVLKNKYYISLKSHFTNDRIRDFSYNDNGVTVTTIVNTDYSNWYQLTLYAPFEVGIWNSSLFCRAGLMDMKNDVRRASIASFDLEWHNYVHLTDDWGVDALVRYGTPNSENLYVKELRHYCLLNVSTDYRCLNNHLAISAGVDDILNTRGVRHTIATYDNVAQEVYAYPSTGRTYWVSVRYNFSAGRKQAARHDKATSNSDEMGRL